MVADLLAHIVADASVLHGQVRFRGTRVPVSVDQYPSIPVDATQAALACAAVLAREELSPLVEEAKLDENLPAGRW